MSETPDPITTDSLPTLKGAQREPAALSNFVLARARTSSPLHAVKPLSVTPNRPNNGVEQTIMDLRKSNSVYHMSPVLARLNASKWFSPKQKKPMFFETLLAGDEKVVGEFICSLGTGRAWPKYAASLNKVI